jgi:hypothetical protein
LASRTIQMVQRNLTEIASVFIRVLEIKMRILSGKRIESKNPRQSFYLEKFMAEQIKIVGVPIKFAYGYECSKTAAFVSSLVILVVAWMYLSEIQNNAFIVFLLIPVWIVILFVLDEILPFLCLHLINGILLLRDSNIWGRVRV